MSKWRKATNFRWAAEWKSLFNGILPREVTEAAMATCRFQLRGKDSHGNEWGKGVVTLMQTFGRIPLGLSRAFQRKHHWIELDAHESANLILGCFGLTIDDVYAAVGCPGEGETIDLDLYDAVTACCDDFRLTTAEASVA